MGKILNTWVYDIEQYRNFHNFCARRIYTQDRVRFVLHPAWSYMDRHRYKAFLDTKPVLIGFNNLNYDYPIVSRFYRHGHTMLNPAPFLYQLNEQIIHRNLKAQIWEPDHLNLDLYRIQHFDNKARGISLKGLEFNFHMMNIKETPLEFGAMVEVADIPGLNDYCDYDVDATHDLFLRTKKKIELRMTLAKRYPDIGNKFLNMPDASIGEKLIISLYCSRTGKTEEDIKKSIAKPKKIELASCIHDTSRQLLYNTPFQGVLKKLEKKVITPETTRKNDKNKKSKELRVGFLGVGVDFGYGGIHGSRCGVFSATNGYRLLDADVTSLYPNMAKALDFSIRHLNHTTYLDIYDGEIIGVRMAEKDKPKELQDKVIIAGYKLAANGAYGRGKL